MKAWGAWAAVWSRFTEAPERYPQLPALLRGARATSFMSVFADDEAWPQDNETGETMLRGGLVAAASADDPQGARRAGPAQRLVPRGVQHFKGVRVPRHGKNDVRTADPQRSPSRGV